jgi:hypothetical protein
MTTTVILNIAITLVVVYLVLAIIITAINEAFFTLTRLRSKFLRRAIDHLFFDADWNKISEKIKTTPFINSLRKAPHIFPSIIPTTNFTSALLSVIGKGSLDLKAIKEQVNEYQGNSEVYSLLRTLLSKTNITIEELNKEIDKIYDNAMERLTAGFKKYAQILSFGIAFVLALILNLDTIDITLNLYKNKEEAEKIAGLALAATSQIQRNESGKIVLMNDKDIPLAEFNVAPADKADITILNDTTLSDSGKVKLLMKEIKSNSEQAVSSYKILIDLGIPMGWSKNNMPQKGKDDPYALIFALWLLKLMGILMTAFATSLGAPFWFDVLNKVSPLRKQAAEILKK